MTAIVVSGSAPFGAMSNSIAPTFDQLDQFITRLEGAAAAAASGYIGTAGTEYEGGNFGVVASATPGAQGTAWRFAVDSLASNWATFKAANIAFVTALDNG